jgi:hypothetical protein
MGVKDLCNALEQQFPRPKGTNVKVDESTQVFALGVSSRCSIAINELLCDIHAFMPGEITVTAFMDSLLTRMRDFFRSDDARVWWELADTPGVPKQKAKTQAKRATTWKRSKSVSTAEGAGARNNEPYPAHKHFTIDGIYDEKTKTTDEMMSPTTVAHTRHMRAELCDALFDYVRRDTFHDQAYVVWDCHATDLVRILHRGTVTYHTVRGSRAAEGEVRAVARMRFLFELYPQYIPASMRYVPTDGSGDSFDEDDAFGTPTRIAIRTKDADVLPLLVKELWNMPRAQVYWINWRGKYVNVTMLIAKLRRAGWSWQAFMIVCLLSGTDYVEKNCVTRGVGIAVMWDSCFQRISALSADGVDLSNTRQLIDVVTRMAYATKLGAPPEGVPSWRWICEVVGEKKSFDVPVDNTFSLRNTAVDPCLWNYQYWASCGEETGPPQQAPIFGRAQQFKKAAPPKPAPPAAAAAAAAADAAPFDPFDIESDATAGVLPDAELLDGMEFARGDAPASAAASGNQPAERRCGQDFESYINSLS